MGFITFVIIMVVVVFVGTIIVFANASPEQREEMLHGPINPHMACPHCNSTGLVRTKSVTQKKGISGGKATAAVLTGGLSMLATGLSRKENNTQAYCGKCHNTWLF
jgi:hypothetical protein